jgi:hypothetical protein
VVGVHRANPKRADVDLVALLDLHDASEAPPAHEDPGASRHDHLHGAVEPCERRQVEVVEMAVRNEDGVDTCERGARNRSRPAQVHDGPPQHRVREQARSVEADDDGAVAKPGDRILRRYADSSTRRFIPVG